MPFSRKVRDIRRIISFDASERTVRVRVPTKKRKRRQGNNHGSISSQMTTERVLKEGRDEAFQDPQFLGALLEKIKSEINTTSPNDGDVKENQSDQDHQDSVSLCQALVWVDDLERTMQNIRFFRGERFETQALEIDEVVEVTEDEDEMLIVTVRYMGRPGEVRLPLNRDEEDFGLLYQGAKSFLEGRAALPGSTYDEYLQRLKREEVCLENVMFCCRTCTCGRKCRNGWDFFQFESPSGWYHRTCCHGLDRNGMNLRKGQDGKRKAKGEKRLLSLTQKGNNALNQHIRHENDLRFKPDPVSQLMTSQTYLEFIQKFKNAPMFSSSGINVLSLFDGIGTTTVALKRLGIPINLVIACELDPVSAIVSLDNHGGENCDGITYLHEKKQLQQNLPALDNGCIDFEFVKDNLEMIIDKTGPFDLVTAGPPCQDYTQINARREGMHGNSGKYLLMTADILKDIRKKQGDFFFCVENVPMTSKEGLDEIDSAFGVPHIELDARWFSPCQRNRLFWTNIELNRFEFDSHASRSRPDRCIDPGWRLPGDPEKALTLLASKSRIDDSRNVKVREHRNGRRSLGSINIVERERMMGYPEGYIQEPIKNLFGSLQDVFEISSITTADQHWKKHMDEKYLLLDKNHFLFRSQTFPPRTIEDLAIGLPGKSNAANCYNPDEYAKRLIGQAFAVPVFEYVMQKLTDKVSTPLRHYNGYDYTYLWETNLIS